MAEIANTDLENVVEEEEPNKEEPQNNEAVNGEKVNTPDEKEVKIDEAEDFNPDDEDFKQKAIEQIDQLPDFSNENTNVDEEAVVPEAENPETPGKTSEVPSDEITEQIPENELENKVESSDLALDNDQIKVSEKLDESIDENLGVERIEPTSPTENVDMQDTRPPSIADSTKSFENIEDTEDEAQMPSREDLVQMFQQAMTDREGLLQTNHQLQNKLAEYFRRKKTEEGKVDADRTSAADLEQKYIKLITRLDELRKDEKERRDRYEQEIRSIKHACDEKERDVQQAQQEFLEKRKQIAYKSINSRTGKPIPPQDIEQYMANERKKDKEVKAVRLENIKLQNRLKKREAQLKQKEELADGLHMIDFEQLKIENQTYNEKIEERNEELGKLRKKITSTVEVLTHLKEKLQYIQHENNEQNTLLHELDVTVAQKRDVLTRTKQSRDKLRNENILLRQKCGLLGNDVLLRDYEDRSNEAADLRKQLDDLRRRHSELSVKCSGYKKKIDQARAGIMLA